MKEELIELLLEVDCVCDPGECSECVTEGCFIHRAADHLITNGVVIPVRCEKCFYFIPMDDVRECPLYKDYPIDTAVDMGFDGLCGNWDRWTSVDEFCSGGEEEVVDD